MGGGGGIRERRDFDQEKNARDEAPEVPVTWAMREEW